MANLQLRRKNRSRILSLMRGKEQILKKNSMRRRINKAVRNLKRVEEENDKESFINLENSNNNVNRWRQLIF